MAHRVGDRRLAATALLALAQPLAGLDLVAGGALEGVGPALERAGPLLPGAQGEPQLGLGGAGPAGGELEPVALVGRGLLGLGRLGAGLVEAGGERGELGAVGLERGLGVGDGALGALDLGAARADRRLQAAELLGDRCHAGVAVVQGLEGGLDALGDGRGVLSRSAARAKRACSPVAVAAATAAWASSSADWISRRDSPLLEPPRTQPGREDVTVGGHRGDALAAGDEGQGVLGAGDERDAVEELLDGRQHGGGGVDDVAGPDGGAVERRPARRGRTGAAVSPTRSVAAAVVVLAQRVDGAGGLARRCRRRAPRTPSRGRPRRRPRGRR